MVMAMSDKFWTWFDAMRDAAIATEDGKLFHAAGFDLTHTGGGCTAWERVIPDTPYVLWITNSNAGHDLTQEDIDYYGETWLLGAHELNEGYYTDCLTSFQVRDILAKADWLTDAVKSDLATFHA